MKKIMISLLVIFSFYFVTQYSQSQSVTRNNQFSTIKSSCDEIIDFSKKHPNLARFFGEVEDEKKPNSSKWKKFKSKKARQLVEDKNYLSDSAEVWLKNYFVVFVSIHSASPSGDWTLEANYCFDESGKLSRIDSELRTFHGNMIVRRKAVYDSSGHVISQQAKYFDLETKKPTTESGPTGSGFMDATIPIYKKVSELPFYFLL